MSVPTWSWTRDPWCVNPLGCFWALYHQSFCILIGFYFSFWGGIDSEHQSSLSSSLFRGQFYPADGARQACGQREVGSDLRRISGGPHQSYYLGERGSHKLVSTFRGAFWRSWPGTWSCFGQPVMRSGAPVGDLLRRSVGPDYNRESQSVHLWSKMADLVNKWF